jgi:pilus assembly protein Flp/PilA
MHLIAQFLKDETAATAIEYSLIAGLIAIVIIGAVTKVGTRLPAKFVAVGNALT